MTVPLPRLAHIEKGFEQQVGEPPIKFKVNKKDWLSGKIKYTPYTHCTKPFAAFIRNACAKISDGSYARKVNIYSYDSVNIYQAMD